MKKSIAEIICAVFAALLSQAGMALVVRLGNIYRFVTLKSTVAMIFVAVFAALLLSALYELFGKKGHVFFCLSFFCLVVTVDSLLNPVNEVYYRYPSLAAVLFVLFGCTPVIFGKHEREKVKLIAPGLSQENIFAIIALTAGLLVASMLPVCSYNSWDDETHYHRVSYFSQGIYSSETEADIDLIYSPIIKPNSKEQFDFEDKLNNEEENPESVVAYSDSRAFFPDRIGYLGILFFTWIGRLLKLPFTVRYTLGRIGNLILYVSIMYMAIRHLKRGKTLLCVLALSTTSIFVSANYSYDPWVFSLSALSFSYFFNAIDNKEKLTNREIIIMVGSLFLAVLPKTPYAFLLLFLLLMPKMKFTSTKQIKLYWILIIACTLGLVLLTYASTFGTGNIADARFSDEPVSAVDQLKFIISDPVKFIKLLLSFLISYLNPANFYFAFTTMGGIAVGKYLFLYLMVLLFSAITDSVSTKPYIRIIGILICVFMAAILAIVFYLIYTPVGKDFIAGCQERYLIPVMFPIFTLLFGGYINLNRKNIVIDYIPIIIASVILALNLGSILL